MAAILPDLNRLLQAGIDPKTGLPSRVANGCNLADACKKILRISDEQTAINRYVWYNLPEGLNSTLLERVLYYKGTGMFFYMPLDSKFYFLPYALNGTIDVYGRYTGVTPYPFQGSTDNGKGKPWIDGLVKKPQYDVIPDLTIDIFDNGCVLLDDYSRQLSQTILSRQVLNDPVVEAEAEAFPMARTALIANSGVKGVRVQSEDDAANVKAASRSITRASMNGDPWIPITGTVDFQELTNGSTPSAQEFLLYMQALDNFRLSTLGVKTGGLFQKQAHMLQSEQALNDQDSHLVYQDGLINRQRFCNIANSIWGLNMWCESSDAVLGSDQDNDGTVMNDNYENSQPEQAERSKEEQSDDTNE